MLCVERCRPGPTPPPTYAVQLIGILPSMAGLTCILSRARWACMSSLRCC